MNYELCTYNAALHYFLFVILAPDPLFNCGTSYQNKLLKIRICISVSVILAVLWIRSRIRHFLPVLDPRSDSEEIISDLDPGSLYHE
jgi:hypothetical protein